MQREPDPGPLDVALELVIALCAIGAGTCIAGVCWITVLLLRLGGVTW